MSIPEFEMTIGDLFEQILNEYTNGQLTINGNIMTPIQAVEYFNNQAIEYGFNDEQIADSADELQYCLKDVEKAKYEEYLESKWKNKMKIFDLKINPIGAFIEMQDIKTKDKYNNYVS